MHWKFFQQKPKKQEDFSMGEEEKQQIAAFGFSIIGELVSGRLHPEEQVRLIREKSRRIRQIPILI